MIAIIDYDAGNLTSVARALAHIGAAHVVTRDPATIRSADRIIFPGVGAAASAMESLKKYGLDAILKEAVAAKTPLLGICLGTQIITGFSEEGAIPCLDIVPGSVKTFSKEMQEADGRLLKIPHMGWNRVTPVASHPVLSGMDPCDEFYFVHGYYPAPQDPSHVLAETEYGIRFASVIGFGTVVATQFHPEKSGRPGLRLLENFCKWEGK